MKKIIYKVCDYPNINHHNYVEVENNLNNSLMLVTALNTKIGYEKAATIAKTAHQNGTTLKEETIKSGLINEKDYEKIVDPKKMLSPK